MQAILVIAVIAFIIWITAKFWYVTLALIAIGVAFYMVSEKKKAAAARRAAEEQARATADAKRQKELELQRAYRKQIALLNDETMATFESLSSDLNAAEQLLDRATKDLAEGAFVPFWDSVEKATSTLGRFDDRVRQINRNSEQYIDLAKKCDGHLPSFAISSDAVPPLRIGLNTSGRMNQIAREAHRNHQFAMVYAQRNRDLARAIDPMTEQISSSIDDLNSSVNAVSSMLTHSADTIRVRTLQSSDVVTAHAREADTAAQGCGVREKKALEMLDNIKRQRYPNLS